jgi:predicted hydrocarbon binding protein
MLSAYGTCGEKAFSSVRSWITSAVSGVAAKWRGLISRGASNDASPTLEDRFAVPVRGPLGRAKGRISGEVNRRAVSNVGARVSTLLNRRVLTESDKKKLLELKELVLDDTTSESILQAKARLASKANKRVLVESLMTTFWSVADLEPGDATRWILSDGNRGRLHAIRMRLLSRYRGFRLWLKKPVTVGTVLAFMGLWAFAITFTRFAFPWSEIGYTSGYGAVFMTAAMATRLTVNSPTLWLERPRRQEVAEAEPPKVTPKEVNSWIIETALARRSLVLHEIQVFLGSGLDGRVKDVNLKSNAFLMRKKDWQALQDALYETFLRGAPPLLFELGHRLGSSVGRDLMRLREKPGAMLSQLESVSRNLGWGIITVDGDLAHGSKLTFTVRESPFCVADSPLVRNTNSCHMLEGLMGGIAEEVYGWPCVSVEQRCTRDGSECCKIVVTAAMVPPSRKERWNLSVLFPTLYPWSR